jgi:hypothetical protein
VKKTSTGAVLHKSRKYGGIDRAVCFVVVTILEVSAVDTHGGARLAVPSLKKNGEGFGEKKMEEEWGRREEHKVWRY